MFPTGVFFVIFINDKVPSGIVTDDMKFHKEKSSMLTMSPPELTEEQVRERRQDEQRIGEFWRSYRRPPQRFVSERKARSKR